MNHKKATQVLIKIIEKYSLSDEEKEAVLTSIGVLSWTSLAEGARKAIRDKRRKELLP